MNEGVARVIRAHYEQLSEFERGRLIGLKEAGWANRRITRHMSRSNAAIRRCWQEWLTVVDFSVRMSYKSLRRHLSVKATHCRDRLQWFLALSGWNHADWGRIVFSDESRFQLFPDDRRRRVRKHPRQRTDPAFTISRYTGPHSRVMVWGAISFDSLTLLVVIKDTTYTAQQYVDDVLRTVLLPFI
ncbi:HTH_Tnp_Tc3_2 domain-containing protein [Trichonephila clavipes]|uniref:HTH_Tnp_Tc3_2 domain-containing protein n=1 Tax=Trichonephila clavipes TaxID=2585209 RepID=A0A8X6W0V9_TRICX|nr:HTH_Tnp_Tc3_2 domain-containing protein [Trichonephila clavipes]